jgi:hypothetical protein
VTPESDALKLDALIRLGIGRQARELDTRSQDVYLEDLEAIDADIVVEACQRLRRAPRDEFDTTFPSVGTILAECKAVRIRRAQQQRDALIATASPKLLQPPNLAPMSREEARALMTSFRARVAERLREKARAEESK